MISKPKRVVAGGAASTSMLEVKELNRAALVRDDLERLHLEIR
jgi:hypothetical protein